MIFVSYVYWIILVLLISGQSCGFAKKFFSFLGFLREKILVGKIISGLIFSYQKFEIPLLQKIYGCASVPESKKCTSLDY